MHHPRSLPLLAAVVVAIACGADSSVAPPKTSGLTVIAKLAGDSQKAPVVTLLPGVLVAQAYVDTLHGASTYRASLSFVPDGSPRRATDTLAIIGLGLPLKNTLVSFVVREGDTKCGHPFSNAEISDSTGLVKQHWTLGQLAGSDCHLDVTSVDQKTGVATTYATFVAQGEPGPVKTAQSFVGDSAVHVADTLDIAKMITQPKDQYGNAVVSFRIRHVRVNADASLSDQDYIEGGKVGIRSGDSQVLIRLDSTAIHGFQVHIVP
jgi:hypothetical protein